jgi:hypothetical protein
MRSPFSTISPDDRRMSPTSVGRWSSAGADEAEQAEDLAGVDGKEHGPCRPVRSCAPRGAPPALARVPAAAVALPGAIGDDVLLARGR